MDKLGERAVRDTERVKELRARAVMYERMARRDSSEADEIERLLELARRG